MAFSSSIAMIKQAGKECYELFFISFQINDLTNKSLPGLWPVLAFFRALFPSLVGPSYVLVI